MVGYNRRYKEVDRFEMFCKYNRWDFTSIRLKSKEDIKDDDFQIFYLGNWVDKSAIYGIGMSKGGRVLGKIKISDMLTFRYLFFKNLGNSNSTSETQKSSLTGNEN